MPDTPSMATLQDQMNDLMRRLEQQNEMIAAMQQNLQSLIDQIKMAVPTTTVTADVKPGPRLTAVAADDSEAVVALRSELDGLRQELGPCHATEMFRPPRCKISASGPYP